MLTAYLRQDEDCGATLEDQGRDDRFQRRSCVGGRVLSGMRVVVFGASGPTGRRIVDQAVAGGNRVVAVTRRPERIAERDRVTVVGADAADRRAVDEAVAGSDAVLSALGVPYGRKPISIYSTGVANIVLAMEGHGVRRLVVVSSAPLDPDYLASDSWMFSRILEPLFMRRPGRTTYEDMARMEAVVRSSKLDWTVVRSSWLFEADQVSDYRLAEGTAEGMYTARSDLAAAMLAQLGDERFKRRTVAVNTTAGTPGLITQIWRENIRGAGRR